MTEPMVQNFDPKLLDYIKLGEKQKVKSLIKKNNSLINASDDNGATLLHYAAEYNNAEIIRHLIELGADVDRLNSKSRTALMIAVRRRSAHAVAALLEANANIDIVDAKNKTATELMFAAAFYEPTIFTTFVRRFRSDSSSDDEFFDRLIAIGTSMYDTVFLKDLTIMKGLLERGVHVDSISRHVQAKQTTALHVAAAVNDLELAKWLLDNNADVDAFDADKLASLGYAAFKIHLDMIHLLLERGANPNIKNFDKVTPLCVLIFSARGKVAKDVDRCIEILFEYGAILQQIPFDNRSILDLALDLQSSKVMKLLIAHLALLQKRGLSIDQIIKSDNFLKHPKMLPKLLKDCYKCKEMLESKIYGELTLFDLFNESKDKMRTRVRNKSLMMQIKRINSQLARNYPLYFNLLKKRTTVAIDIVKLEDEAISALCKLLQRSYNQCHSFARDIVGYLSEHDLEQLCQSVQD